MNYNKILSELIVSHKEMDINVDISQVENNLRGLRTYKSIYYSNDIKLYIQIAFDYQRPGKLEEKYDLFGLGMGQTRYINKNIVDYKLVHELYQEMQRLHNNFLSLYTLHNLFKISINELSFKLEEFDVLTQKGKTIDKISLQSLHEYYGVEMADSIIS